MPLGQGFDMKTRLKWQKSMNRSRVQFVECLLLSRVTAICHWATSPTFSLCRIVPGSSGVTAGPRSCPQAVSSAGLSRLDGCWLGPPVLSGHDCCVKTTYHLLVKMFWILNNESLISPAVPSAARTNLPVGLYRGVSWKTLSYPQ